MESLSIDVLLYHTDAVRNRSIVAPSFEKQICDVTDEGLERRSERAKLNSHCHVFKLKLNANIRNTEEAV